MTGNDITASLNTIDYVTVDGIDYVVYTDASFTHAVRQYDWDAADEVEFEDYTAWCQRVPAVADRSLALKIITAAGIERIHLGDGCCTAVERPESGDTITNEQMDALGKPCAIVREVYGLDGALAADAIYIYASGVIVAVHNESGNVYYESEDDAREHYDWNEPAPLWLALNGPEVHPHTTEGRSRLWAAWCGNQIVREALDNGMGDDWQGYARHVLTEAARIDDLAVLDEDVDALANALRKYALEDCA